MLVFGQFSVIVAIRTSLTSHPISQISVIPNELMILIFSDLDGCLLNHDDYSFSGAQEALNLIHQRNIPLILASSKTEAEMRGWAEKIGNVDWLICENGGVILNDEQRFQPGRDRQEIVAILENLKGTYEFRSYTEMGVDGVMEATGLAREQATKSSDRHTTEPLQWLDEDSKVAAFQEAIEAEGLTCTRGGRFWHIAGQVTKGTGMQFVIDKLKTSSADVTTIALGDSPIDIPMLKLADYAIVVPNPRTLALMSFDHNQRQVAPHPGSDGWGASMLEILSKIPSS